MSTITLPNIRVSSDLTVKVRLKDNGVAIDWSTLNNVKASIYSDAQRALAGRCDVSVDAEDPTVLVCQYAANKPQYVGVCRIVVSAKYMGETKTYDKPAFNFVRWTADQDGEQITIDDPDVDVEIEVSDVSSSLLDEAIRAAFTAAEEAVDAKGQVLETEEEVEAAEALRVSAEESRVEAEEGRAEAEAARVDEEAVRVSAEDARVVAENARAAAEDLREGAEDDRAAAETARETAEAARVAAEALRVTAEGSRETAEAAREAQASADHTVAAGDHTQAAADHTQAAADHTTAASDHTQAGADHTLAAADHVTAGEDHAQAQDDHEVMAGYDTRLGNVEGEVSQLEAKVDDLSTGKYYGYYATESDLPDDATVDGFAYVGSGPTYTIYNCEGGVWTSSGITVNQSPIGNEEDIDQNEDGKLRFANRVYDAQNPNGMGYKILRKTTDFASQVTDTNTVYEIRYDFNLSANVSIPANCELRFNGGKIIGGGNTITFNKTLISGNGKFDGCEFAGSIINAEVLISWFTDGMSSDTDYSADHSGAVLSAMKLTSLIKRGWLNLERIKLCIKQTIVITNTFGNIGMKNGWIAFLSTADYQPVFDYQQSASNTGEYSPIVDTIATYRGTVAAPSIKHKNVCFIKKTFWSDTYFTYWRDIQVHGFAYFMVNLSYLQEVTFQNISCGGGGFLTNNSEGMYGQGKGSGNILNFLNCNINNGSITTSVDIHYLFDLHDVIEAHFTNIVCQGVIYGTNIYPIHISKTNSYSNANITLDGFWVEYPSKNVKNAVLVENSTVVISVRKRGPATFDIVDGYVTIKLENAQATYIGDLLKNFYATDTANCVLQIDADMLGTITGESYEKLLNLIERGIVEEIKTGIANYGALSVPFTCKANFKVDYIANYLSTMTGNKTPNRPINIYMTSENGVDVLCFEHDGTTATYYESNIFGGLARFLQERYTTYQGKAVLKDIIYRVTTLVAATEENIADIYCSAKGLFTDPGGAMTSLITPQVGDPAGTTTGWVRKGGIMQDILNAAPYLKIRNCKLEIANFNVSWRNGEINNDVLLKSGVLSNPNNIRKIYQMSSIPAAKDNVADMSNIIQGASGIFVTPKNVYMYVNGAVRAIYDYNAKGGTTAQRPTLASGDVGFTYYDSNLGKTIVWDGSAWVNLDGTALS